MSAAGDVCPARERPAWLGGLALVALVVAVFWPVLTFDFVRWDDDINITQNPLLTAPWSWELAGQFFAGEQAMRFEPLHWLCYRVLHAVFGFNPMGWHAFGLGLHAMAAVLFYFVLRQIGRLLAPKHAEIHTDLAAWLGAALWAVHPLRAETVAWVTASTYSHAAVWLLASFWCYLRAYARPTRAGRWLALAWGFAVAGYASYPVGITYALWLMAVDRWLLPATRDNPRLWAVGWNRVWWAKHACFLAPAALAVALTLWSRFTAPGIFGAAPTLESVSLPARVTMAMATLTCLVGDFLWPVGLTPNLQPLVLGGEVQRQVTLMALLALLALVAAWRGERRRPTWALVWLGFAALALPCLGWVEKPKWPDDRYSYLVDLVLVGGATFGLLRLAGENRARRIGLGALAVGLVLFSACAVRDQSMIWRDSTTLFASMEQDPHFADSPRQQGQVYFLWGFSELASARPAAAARLISRARQILVSAIQASAAREDYSEALALSVNLEHYLPLPPALHRERGLWLLLLGRRSEALVELRAAQAAMPDDARVQALIEEAQK